MDLRKYEFQCKGDSSLLMHADNIEWSDAIAKERSAIKESDKKAFAAGDDRCPTHTWKGYVYTDLGESQVVMPTDNLRSCLMRAAAQVELKGKKTYKELSQGAIIFDDEFAAMLVAGKPLPFKSIKDIHGSFAEQAEAVRALGFRLFVKRAVIGQAKHVRVRPRFDDWSVSGTFTVIDDQVSTEIIKKIWGIAGMYKGIGDWRPGARQSPGPYGRFTTTIKLI